MTDYLKIDSNTVVRPITGIYEFSSIVTQLSQTIYNSPDLSNYIEDGIINDMINPSALSVELIKKGTYDAYMNKDSNIIKFSNTYINPTYYEMLEHYYNQHDKIKNKYVTSKFQQLSQAKF